jgi:hypothetical protein
MDIRSAMRRVPRYRWFLFAAVVAAGLFFTIQMGFLPVSHGGQAPKGFDLLDSLMRLIRNDYLEDRDPVMTSEGTYRGLVNSIRSRPTSRRSWRRPSRRGRAWSRSRGSSSSRAIRRSPRSWPSSPSPPPNRLGSKQAIS